MQGREPAVIDTGSLDCVTLTDGEAAARFEEARARGHMRWPWPELTGADCRAALRQFERAAFEILTLGVAREPLAGDSNTIGIAAYICGMGPLLAWWIENGFLRASPEIADTLRLHLAHNRLRNTRLAYEAGATVARLRARRIEPVLLKGMHTGRAYFPDPATRPVSDVDLLVDARDAECANQAIEETGAELIGESWFERTWRPPGSASLPRTLCFNHCDDPWSIDLHSTLDRPIEMGRILRFDRSLALFEQPFERCLTAKVLPQPLLTLYLACHAGCDFDSLTLLRLCELALVIHKDHAEAKLDWEAFVTHGALAGALDVAYPALKLCEALSAGSVPEWVLARCRKGAPRAVVRFVERLSPADAQRLRRVSVIEHYMWARTVPDLARRMFRDIWPKQIPIASANPRFDARFRRIFKGLMAR